MNNPRLLGTVEDVKGSTVRVSLSDETASGLAFIDGRGYRIGQIGSFVRISLGYTELFGVVSQVGAGASSDELAEARPFGQRWMVIQLVGEGDRRGEFQRGISQYPTVDDPVYIVTEDDLARIYGSVDSPHYVAIGTLAASESIPALVDVSKLVTRHSAIVGSTGSGKSTTVASILTSITDETTFESGRVLVLDPHGEYAKALPEANLFQVTPEAKAAAAPLHIPYWALTFDELMPVIFGDLDDSARDAILQSITDLKREALIVAPRPGVNVDDVTVDTPVPFSIHKLWFDLHRLVHATHLSAGGQSSSTEALEKDATGAVIQPGDALKVIAPRYVPHTQAAGATKVFLSTSPLNIRRQVDGLAARLRDPRFGFFFQPGVWATNELGQPAEDLDSLLASWLGGTHPVTILDLSGIPFSVLTHLVGVLLRVIFDALFWARDLSEGGRERPLLIVLEEAHTYLGTDRAGPAADAVKRIVKEGRKYGMGAMVVSQRPSEIDETILSQCGTMMALRLANPADRSRVTSTAPDNLEGLFAMLPSMRTGEAIIVGEAVHLPLRALISAPPAGRRPDSDDPMIYNESGPGGWNRRREPSDYGDVLGAWRRQDRKSARLVPAPEPEQAQ